MRHNILYICSTNENTVGIHFWFPADFVRLHSDKEMISLYFLLVGLFEQWETNLSKQNPEKRISKKLCNE